MTTEQFLNSLRFIDNEIQALNLERARISDQRQSILDLAESWGGLSGVCVQSTPGSKTESLGIRLALVDDEFAMKRAQQYAERIRRKWAELLDRKLTAMQIIENIQDAKYRTLITLRYLNNLKWSSVADMMGYTEDWVQFKLRRQVIDAFEQSAKESGKIGLIVAK